MSRLVKIATSAGDPRMIERAAAAFDKLREYAGLGSGIDFLAKCGDVLRPADYYSPKDGVANRSWHKTGRAFDYDQTSKSIQIVSDPKGGKQFFRTFLICSKQDGSFGEKRIVRDIRGGSTSGYVFDFTRAAEIYGFARIPAWSGWQTHYNRKEFWHYQMTDGLTWDAAMLQLRGKERSEADRVIGLNDRGDDVLAIEKALRGLNLLSTENVNGVFDAATFEAVKVFQRRNRLAVDGIVGPRTRKAMGLK